RRPVSFERALEGDERSGRDDEALVRRERLADALEDAGGACSLATPLERGHEPRHQEDRAYRNDDREREEQARAHMRSYGARVALSPSGACASIFGDSGNNKAASGRRKGCEARCMYDHGGDPLARAALWDGESRAPELWLEFPLSRSF